MTPTLEGVAHARGYEATSNRTRGMLTSLPSNPAADGHIDFGDSQPPSSAAGFAAQACNCSRG